MSARYDVRALLMEHYRPSGKAFSGMVRPVGRNQEEEPVSGVEGIYSKPAAKNPNGATFRMVMTTRSGKKVSRAITYDQANALSEALEIDIEEDPGAAPVKKAGPRSDSAARTAARARKTIPRACAIEVDEECVFDDSVGKSRAAAARNTGSAKAARAAAGSAAKKAPGRPKKEKKAPGGQKGVKRGPSGYNLYSKDNYAKFKALAGAGAGIGDVSRLIGQSWKSASPGTQAKYNAQAAALKPAA